MRNLVSIQDPTEAIDATGTKTYAYTTTEEKVWARVRNVSQNASMDGDIQKAGIESYEVRIRWRDNITYDTRLLFRDLTLQVRGIENVLERAHPSGELILSCEVADL
jgi:SPP1 family predicted phage head-tail adaptor